MGQAYTQLSVEERRKIERWRIAGISPTEMARVLDRHRSTIFRELRRNHFQDPDFPKVVGYFAIAAHDRTARRRERQRKLVRHSELRTIVETRLKAGWTPEQIAGRMRLEDTSPRVCQETIYRHVYSKDGMRSELWWHLPNHRMSRRPRRYRKRRAPRFSKDVSILFRPDVVAHRTEFGHWEGDLVLFRQHFGQSNVTSLIERVSRFTVLLRNTSKRSKPVMGKITKAIRTLPLAARKSITFDRGSEFVNRPHLQAELGTDAWFCDPQSPHQKGAVENTNRRLRRFLPREIDLKLMTDDDIRAITDRMNGTPRKCLGWRTPAEVFAQKMMEIKPPKPYSQAERKSHFR